MSRLITVDLPVDRDSAVPIPEQIVRAVRDHVASGALRPGEPFASSRALAAHLGVSRGTVVVAYDQLIAEGYLIAAPRSGVRIHPDLATALRRTPAPRPTRALTQLPHRLPLDFIPGHEQPHPLADADWRRALRRAVDPPGREVWRPEAQGEPELRSAIADHLRVMRGIQPSLDGLFVTGGAREGLSVLLEALRPAYHRPIRVAVETPGFPGLRRALARSAAELVAMPVDGDGPQPISESVELALVTPNHQFPHGTAITAARRQELLAWAQAAGTVLVEDDYDSEFRHLGPALPALWPQDPGRVVHLGTFTGVLGRDIALGYLLVPPPLREPVRQARDGLGLPVSPLIQRAVADYLSEGGLRRRIVRSRRRLTAAGRAVAEALARHGLAEDSAVVDTGHLLVIGCDEATAARVRRGCARRGVGVGLLAEGWADAPQRAGLVFSYGTQPVEQVAAGVEILLSVFVASVKPWHR